MMTISMIGYLLTASSMDNLLESTILRNSMNNFLNVMSLKSAGSV